MPGIRQGQNSNKPNVSLVEFLWAAKHHIYEHGGTKNPVHYFFYFLFWRAARVLIRGIRNKRTYKMGSLLFFMGIDEGSFFLCFFSIFLSGFFASYGCFCDKSFFFSLPSSFASA